MSPNADETPWRIARPEPLEGPFDDGFDWESDEPYEPPPLKPPEDGVITHIWALADGQFSAGTRDLNWPAGGAEWLPRPVKLIGELLAQIGLRQQDAGNFCCGEFVADWNRRTAEWHPYAQLLSADEERAIATGILAWVEKHPRA